MKTLPERMPGAKLISADEIETQYQVEFDRGSFWLDLPTGKDPAEVRLIFVFSGRGGIGVKNDRIRAILSQYRNVFYISGHIHEGLCRGKTENGYTWSSVEDLHGIRLINAPCFMFPNHDGNPMPGKGYMLEIFDDRVILLGRDFLRGTWEPNFVYSFVLS